jgi:hypothetical protein
MNHGAVETKENPRSDTPGPPPAGDDERLASCALRELEEDAWADMKEAFAQLDQEPKEGLPLTVEALAWLSRGQGAVFRSLRKALIQAGLSKSSKASSRERFASAVRVGLRSVALMTPLERASRASGVADSGGSRVELDLEVRRLAAAWEGRLIAKEMVGAQNKASPRL